MEVPKTTTYHNEITLYSWVPSCGVVTARYFLLKLKNKSRDNSCLLFRLLLCVHHINGAFCKPWNWKRGKFEIQCNPLFVGHCYKHRREFWVWWSIQNDAGRRGNKFRVCVGWINGRNGCSTPTRSGLWEISSIFENLLHQRDALCERNCGQITCTETNLKCQIVHIPCWLLNVFVLFRTPVDFICISWSW